MGQPFFVEKNRPASFKHRPSLSREEIGTPYSIPSFAFRMALTAPGLALPPVAFMT
jgi:hypothetical protein